MLLQRRGNRLGNAMTSIERLLVIKGPRGTLESDLVSQHAAARFRLTHAFSVASETTFGKLAAQAGMGDIHTRKLVRHAITRSIFCEPRPLTLGYHTLSVLAPYCREQGSLWPPAIQDGQFLACSLSPLRCYCQVARFGRANSGREVFNEDSTCRISQDIRIQ